MRARRMEGKCRYHLAKSSAWVPVLGGGGATSVAFFCCAPLLLDATVLTWMDAAQITGKKMHSTLWYLQVGLCLLAPPTSDLNQSWKPIPHRFVTPAEITPPPSLFHSLSVETPPPGEDYAQLTRLPPRRTRLPKFAHDGGCLDG